MAMPKVFASPAIIRLPLIVTAFAQAMPTDLRHCEERSDEAIQDNSTPPSLDCFASLAMTAFTLLRYIELVGVEMAQHGQLALARRLGRFELVRHQQLEAGVVLDFIQGHPGMERQHLHAAALLFEAHDR